MIIDRLNIVNTSFSAIPENRQTGKNISIQFKSVIIWCMSEIVSVLYNKYVLIAPSEED